MIDKFGLISSNKHTHEYRKTTPLDGGGGVVLVLEPSSVLYVQYVPVGSTQHQPAHQAPLQLLDVNAQRNWTTFLPHPLFSSSLDC